jgi:hypothetical protein
MSIDWSTEHVQPNFTANSFGSEATHVKRIYGYLLTNLAYMNPLADDIDAMVARIDAVKALLATEMSASLADANTFAVYAGTSGSGLPQGWIDATNDSVPGYTAADMSSVASTVMSYYNNLVALDTDLTTLKNFVTVIDLDNFKLHMELTSGVDMSPPPGIIKPNNPALMALVMSLTELENRFGISFRQFGFYKADGTLDTSGSLGGGSNLFSFYTADGTLDTITIENNELPFYKADGTLDTLSITSLFINHFLGTFGTLFYGDVTIAAAQTDLDTDPLSAGTYSPLGIKAGVEKPYAAGALGEHVIWNNSIVAPKVDPLSVPVVAYNSPIITTHWTALNQHIVDDMAYYDMMVHKVNQMVSAYGISSHIQDPYYAYPYIGVFGTPGLNALIAQYTAGEIT